MIPAEPVRARKMFSRCSFGFQAELALFEHDTVDENTEHLMKLHVVCLEVLKLENLAMGWFVETCTCFSTLHPSFLLD